ncbi:Nuclear transport factor 2 [Tulasnella sp. 403]|nr:Nuclear transport factor 2 [Tulasnella sp. 403]
MSWEGGEFGGVTKILEKLAGLPEGVTHKIDTLDAQPGSATEPSIIVLVTGQLVIENNPPLQFCQTFHLRPQDGSYYVANDLFRLNVG